MRLKYLGVMILAASLVVGPASAFFVTMTQPIKGQLSQVAKTVMDYADQRVAGLDKNNTTAVQSTILDLKAVTEDNVTKLTQALKAQADLSPLVHVAGEKTWGLPAGWTGQRTNTTLAHSPTGLAEGTIALSAELGRPLTTTEQLDVRNQANNLYVSSHDAATAGAVLVYATLDAMHYRQQAFANFDQASMAVLRGNVSVPDTLHRFASVGGTAPNYTLVMGDYERTVLEAANNATTTVDQVALAKALDVLAQAVDEVSRMSFPVSLPGTGPASGCTSTNVLFASGCVVIIGGTDSTTYLKMTSALTGEQNAVVLDLGGADTYQHRAGGGVGAIQVNVDLGTGDDRYVPLGARSAAAHGAGNMGVGLLFDQAGNDTYDALGILDSPGVIGGGEAFVAQGGAYFGAGLLADNSGNDTYVTRERDGTPEVHAQGAGYAGLGILRDLGGTDTYSMILEDDAITAFNAGGAQGFGTLRGTGILLDYGTGNDSYHAGEDLVQGAASLLGFGLLHDEAGANSFIVDPHPGCPVLESYYCKAGYPTDASLAGWSQGYADSNGTGLLVSGLGQDTFGVNGVPATSQSIYQGKSLQGAAMSRGFAVLLSPGGNDTFSSSGSSLGYADAAMAVLLDTAGIEHYDCADTTCYGYGIRAGLGLYYDGLSYGDSYGDGQSRNVPSTRADLGLSFHQEG